MVILPAVTYYATSYQQNADDSEYPSRNFQSAHIIFLSFIEAHQSEKMQQSDLPLFTGISTHTHTVKVLTDDGLKQDLFFTMASDIPNLSIHSKMTQRNK